jgi:hypothetical protein
MIYTAFKIFNKINIIPILIILLVHDLTAQKYDFNWFVGYEYFPNKPLDTSESVNAITFNTIDGNAKLLYEYKSTLDFIKYGCNISDADGELFIFMGW